MKPWTAFFLMAAVSTGLLMARNLSADSLFTKNPSVQAVQGAGTPESSAAQNAQPQGNAALPKKITYSKGMSPGALAALADRDIVELAPGRYLKMGDARRLAAIAQKFKTAQPGSRRPPELRAKPAATGKPLKNPSDLASAFTLPDQETVQLPSGRTYTAGLVKKVREDVEKGLGRRIDQVPQRPSLEGPAVKVHSGSDWKDLLQRPDSTVLESPQGTRITVGELKKALDERRKTSPTSTRPKP